MRPRREPRIPRALPALLLVLAGLSSARAQGTGEAPGVPPQGAARAPAAAAPAPAPGSRQVLEDVQRRLDALLAGRADEVGDLDSLFTIRLTERAVVERRVEALGADIARTEAALAGLTERLGSLERDFPPPPEPEIVQSPPAEPVAPTPPDLPEPIAPTPPDLPEPVPPASPTEP